LLRNSGRKDSTGRKGGGGSRKKSGRITEGEEEAVADRQSEEAEQEDGSVTPTEDHLADPLGALSTINALALEEKEREISEKEREVGMCEFVFCFSLMGLLHSV